MRSWFPISVKELDDKALLGEHNELHIIGKVITGQTKGWKNHPEVNRWRGYSKALKKRHDALAHEMISRGFNHNSEWPDKYVYHNDPDESPGFWEPLEVMIKKLKEKILLRKQR